MIIIRCIRIDNRKLIRKHDFVAIWNLIYPVVPVRTDYRWSHRPMISVIEVRSSSGTTVSGWNSWIIIRICIFSIVYFSLCYIALTIEAYSITVVICKMSRKIFSSSGSCSNALEYIVLVIQNVYSGLWIQISCGILSRSIYPVITAAVIMRSSWPARIFVPEWPIRFFIGRSSFVNSLFTSAVVSVTYGYFSWSCGNCLVHFVKSSCNLKHTLCWRICLIIPYTVIRGSSSLTVFQSLILVDVNIYNNILNRICRRIFTIIRRLHIIILIVLREHSLGLTVNINKIDPCKIFAVKLF